MNGYKVGQMIKVTSSRMLRATRKLETVVRKAVVTKVSEDYVEWKGVEVLSGPDLSDLSCGGFRPSGLSALDEAYGYKCVEVL